MTSNILTQLDSKELSRLEGLEHIVERGKQTFIEVGNALAEIRDSKLYRQTHKTFELYCREKWDWTKTTANRFIQASETVNNLTPIGVIPTSESQIRPLAKLDKDEQYEAWCKANEIADKQDKPVTGAIVQQAVDEIKPKPTISKAKCAKAAAMFSADLAIRRVNEINKHDPGFKAAVTKVIEHCEQLLKPTEK